MPLNKASFPVPPAGESAATIVSVDLRGHLLFSAWSILLLLVLNSALRLALLIYNSDQIGVTPALTFAEAFFNGLRFDLRLVAAACFPLLLALLSDKAMAARAFFCFWLTGVASITLLLGILELDFYREFNQRLNGLVFQYLKEDAKTVLSMLWFGFPVLRYLLAWAIVTWLLARVFRTIDRRTRLRIANPAAASLASGGWLTRLGVFVVCILLMVLAVRGTLRQGPPLRWGDAFTTDSIFANQLGLNGTLSLITAAQGLTSDHRSNIWKSSLPESEARDTVRRLLLLDSERLVDGDTAPVRRDFSPPQERTLPIRNVVLILMESFAGRHVGVLGGQGNITPHFDALAGEGLLFTRFFANGTHTHQGTFASIACFPNLPAFEYLMQTPEGSNGFSGLPQLLGARGFDNLYVYNGDFAWDNQSGFFGRQGVSNFIGRFDYKNPVVFDPTWGVSDQDMFDRAAVELAAMGRRQPFYAILQSLSNHTPYALPERLPVEPVSGHGAIDPHLTAMRYSDWALGQFFDKARKAPYFKETLFVIVGDHGFGSGPQLTEMNLARFNVPLLLIAPGMQEKFGERSDTVGTQVDIVPTIMGRLGGDVRHQCWGRDLLNLPANDKGFGVIKPSGNDQTVAIIRDDKILVKSRSLGQKVYAYQLWTAPQALELNEDGLADELGRALDAYLQVATGSLLDNSTGTRPEGRQKIPGR